jgi:hypothetical protein
MLSSMAFVTWQQVSGQAHTLRREAPGLACFKEVGSIIAPHRANSNGSDILGNVEVLPAWQPGLQAPLGCISWQ